MKINRTTAALLLSVLLAALGGCATMAIWTAPEKKPATQRTPEAAKADALFWDTLHNGRYEQIDTALTAMTAAYLQTPEDAVSAAHVGWLHVWRLAERNRLGTTIPPQITDDAVLSRKYFEEAVKLDPKEARFLGFYASVLLAEGSIHHDEKLTRKGYYTLLDSIDAWPEFNYFTAGYSMAARPWDSARYKEALDYQWKNLDVCVGSTVDRQNPDYTKFMNLETREGVKRVCWNSWIAPHNLEGFFLNFGDMLVKAGQPDVAVKMYSNAKLAKEYPEWKFKGVLEERMKNAAQNVALFQKEKPAATDTRMMHGSSYACMACHQN